MEREIVEEIFSLSEFVERPQEELFGFTITYKNGAIKNYFIKGSLYNEFIKVRKLKKLYRKLKKGEKIDINHL